MTDSMQILRESLAYVSAFSMDILMSSLCQFDSQETVSPHVLSDSWGTSSVRLKYIADLQSFVHGPASLRA